MDDHLLLVLSIVEGRHFLKRPHHQLLIEANFDGETLNTEALKHTDSPRFNTELAWEISKKSLHQHKLQRTPIKLQVFALEASSMRKELVGYCIVDLRSAQQDNIKKATWHNLLHTKYHNARPAVKLCLSVEVDKVKNSAETVEKQKTSATKQAKQPKLTQQLSPPVTPPSSSHPSSMNLDVVLDEEQGYYMIGPQTPDCQVFVMSVSINGIKNLINLLPSTRSIPSENGFYFYYSLFDNDVTNETFYDLLTPNIPTERATVRINTTWQRLHAYLQNKQNLRVYFCSSDTTLGEAVVPLTKLTEPASIPVNPRSIDGMFQLADNNDKDRTSSTISAFVGVSIVLRKEEQIFDPTEISPVRQMASPPKQTVLKSPPTKESTAAETKIRNINKPKTTENVSVVHKSMSPPKQAHLQHEEKNHHFVFSIDLRSISNMDINNAMFCYCRYTYPFFGSAAPVITNPPVYIQRSCEVLLQQSFCQFQFASTMSALQTTFSRVPLIVEIWSKSANYKDVLVGISQFYLSTVFSSGVKNKDQYVCSEKIPIVSGERPGEKIGSMHIVLGFQDKGELETKIAPQRQLSESLTSGPSTDTLHDGDNGTTAVRDDGGRSTQEYQVAMALEMWRQQQEEHFKSQLSAKEHERMKELAEEWKQRDMERELVVKKKIQEYTTLETNLKKSLVELEKRQREIGEREIQLQRNSENIAAEYDRKMVELREASRRLKEDYQHQVNLERARYDDLLLRFEKQKNEMLELEEKVKQRENEIYSLKESMIKRPEVKMQSDMNLLLLEKNEMERKIESITKSKIHYKQQWGRALRELARIKMNEQEEAKSRLKKQQQELDHMKLRYLAAEEKKVLQTEKDELNDVKEEISKKLDDLKKNVMNSNHSNEVKVVHDTEEIYESNANIGSDRVAKLIEERDTLLQTGVYTMDDPVISELDKEIRQALSNNG